MKITREEVIRYQVATAMMQDQEAKKSNPAHKSTPQAGIEKWAANRFDLFEKAHGFDVAVERLIKWGRYASLVAEVSAALGDAAGEWRWDETDEGFRQIKEGIDPVEWLSEQMQKTDSDEAILEAARNIRASAAA